MSDTILANATLVLPDEVIRGTLHIVDGLIAAIDQACGELEAFRKAAPAMQPDAA